MDTNLLVDAESFGDTPRIDATRRVLEQLANALLLPIDDPLANDLIRDQPKPSSCSNSLRRAPICSRMTLRSAVRGKGPSS